MIFFGPQFGYEFSGQFLCDKSILGPVSGGTPLGPPFFFSSFFFRFLFLTAERADTWLK